VTCFHAGIVKHVQVALDVEDESLLAYIEDFVHRHQVYVGSTPRGVTECFIFSEPLIQPTLASVITSSSLSMSDRLSLIEQMLEGLAFIHSEGCMHRDIRPENVLVSSSPLQAVIIDFDCATFDKTSKDHMKGTIRYLAPEVIALKHGIASNDST
jgi:serine/threonine protein kinase